MESLLSLNNLLEDTIFAVNITAETLKFENQNVDKLQVKLSDRAKMLRRILGRMKARKFYDNLKLRGAYDFEATDCRKLNVLIKRGNNKMAKIEKHIMKIH